MARMNHYQEIRVLLLLGSISYGAHACQVSCDPGFHMCYSRLFQGIDADCRYFRGCHKLCPTGSKSNAYIKPHLEVRDKGNLQTIF